MIAALAHAFGLAQGVLVEARAVSCDYGNMSASTAIFVLDRMLAKRAAFVAQAASLGHRRTAGGPPMLTERLLPATLGPRPPSYPKGEVMKRLLEFLNDEAW